MVKGAYSVEWSDEAERTFEANIKHLEEEWNAQVIQAFVDSVNTILSNLKAFPESGRESAKKNARLVTVHKNVLLVYKVQPRRKVIRLIIFLHTKQKTTKRYLS